MFLHQMGMERMIILRYQELMILVLMSKLIVFNRCGTKVFEAEGSQFRWDGTNNENSLAGVYIFMHWKEKGLKNQGS